MKKDHNENDMDALAAIEKLMDAVRTAEQIESLIQGIAAESKKIKRVLEEKIELLKCNDLGDESVRQIKHVYQKYIDLVAMKLSAIYANVYNTCSFSADFCVAENPARQLVEPEWTVEAVADGDTLYVKVPPLLTRNQCYVTARGRLYSRDYLSFFASEARRKIAELGSALPSFRDKNVSIISVYDSTKCEIPDTCNLDTKAMIDAVTAYLPDDDSALTCSFFEVSVVSDSIKTGTYFIVSEGIWTIKSAPEILDALQRFFPKRCVLSAELS